MIVSTPHAPESSIAGGDYELASATDFEIAREAERLFTEHNRANGALMPFGLGWLSAEAKNPWLIKAEATLRERQNS